jgi:two-component system NarL family response regulator
MRLSRIRLLCVDDHRLVREGIASLINAQPDMEVVGSAGSGEEAIAVFRVARPDVTLMDLQLPGMSGLEAIREIRRADATAKIIVVTMHQGEEDVYRALEAGAATYLLKDSLPDDLAATIRHVYSGERPVSPEIKARLAERTSHPLLTRREIEIIKLITQGMRNKEIAAALDVAQDTVRVHLKRIYKKLQVQDRTAIINVAVRRGIIHLG